MWEGYKNFSREYAIFQLEDFFYELKCSLEGDNVKLVGKRVQYWNVPASFDIETTSVKNGDEKFATMYIWQFGINGSVVMGRTWSQFTYFISQLTKFLSLEPYRRLIVYVHNLGYEFQFMRRWIKWAKKSDGSDMIFASKDRRPIYAVSEGGIEFRCSFLLSNYNLAYVGANLLHMYPVQKMVGDLDYSKIRHSGTPLTQAEIQYACNDVRVVMSYIQEKIETEGDISTLPLTNTGYVRRYCRQYCLQDNETDAKNKRRRMFEYRAIMKQLSIRSEKEYDQLKEAFAGGFTHAGVFYSGKTIIDVGSADLTSSYPYAMVAQYFPMSEGVYIGAVTASQLNNFANEYCCLFTIDFFNIYSEWEYDSYISSSHCSVLSDDHVVNNGRVVTAEHLRVTITELDWDIIKKIYSWDDCKISSLRIYERGYLPRPLIMSILQLYQNKTSLKGVEGKEIEYLVSKNMINATYGMAVTSIIRDEHIYSKESWETVEADKVSQLDSYNKNFHRFLYYAWGVWVTAHARHNLWDAIFEFGEDYVYADTDSIKGVNFQNHMDFFTSYNLEVRFALTELCEYYKIPFDMVSPLTKKGERKMIGVWDIEEPYEVFKTLGAKRYLYVHKSGELGMTVSGVNKKYALPWMLRKFTGPKYDTDTWFKFFQLAYSPNPNEYSESKKAMEKLISMYKNREIDYSLIFHHFRQYLAIPEGFTGKQSLTYIDKAMKRTLVDYTGLEMTCYEKSFIHMEPAAYFFSIPKEYTDFIMGIQDGSI